MMDKPLIRNVMIKVGVMFALWIVVIGIISSILYVFTGHFLSFGMGAVVVIISSIVANSFVKHNF